MHQGFPSSQRGRSVPSARRRIRSPARERERAITANPRASRRPERRSHRAGVDDEDYGWTSVLGMLRWDPESLRAVARDDAALREQFDKANTTGSGVIRGEQAVAFLRPSGLPDASLSKIWKAATKGTGQLSSLSEFGECLELVARELENPNALIATPAGQGPKSAVGASPRTPATPGGLVQAPPMTEAERKKYFGHFRTLDHDQKGQVSVESTVKFLSKAALPLSSVQLCVARATMGAPIVDRDAFAVAMHDVYAMIKAQGKTPVTPSITPIASTSAAPRSTDSGVAKLDENFFSSMGSVKANAPPSSSKLLDDSALVAKNEEASRLEKEQQARERAVQSEIAAADANRQAAEARIARAKRAIAAADEDVAAARAAAEAAEVEADRMKHDATVRLQRAQQQHADLVDRESRVKTDAQERINSMKVQYQSTVAEYERLKAQVTNASSVAALPVKTMQDKLSKVEEETRALRLQTDKAATDASQALMKKAVEVAKAERAKAAALRELHAVDAKLELETSRVEKQLEALGAETESAIATRDAKIAAHPGIIEDLSVMLEKYKADGIAEKLKTENAISACDQEVSGLQAKVALAKAELDASKSVLESDLASHQLKLDEHKQLHIEASDALNQAIQQSRDLAEKQSAEITVLDDKIIEAKTALKTEEAAMTAQEQSHEAEMSAKENTLSKLNMNIDSLRAQMEDKYLLSSKALSEADARIEEAEAKSEDQQREMERATTQLLQENEELKEKLQVAKEKEEENARTKASNSETIARKRLENEQLKDQLTVESERVEREMIEVQNDFAQANETLQVERNAFTNALNKLKETVPRSSAVIAQIQALQSSIDSTQLHRLEAEDTAQKAIETYERTLERLEQVALDQAENVADGGVAALSASRSEYADALATTNELTAAKSSHERLPSFVDFEVSPEVDAKTGAFDLDQSFGASRDDAALSDVFASNDTFGAAKEDASLDFDEGAFTISPPTEKRFRSLSLEEPDEDKRAADVDTSSKGIEGPFEAFEQFQPESTESPFEESPFDPQFTGADLVDPTTEEKDDTPVDDLFRQDSPLDDASAPVFSTFENEVFSANANDQWQQDFDSPSREQVSWNPDESTDDAFTTARKPSRDFDDGFEATGANESVFSTPSAQPFHSATDDQRDEPVFASFEASEPATPNDAYVDAPTEIEPTFVELHPIPPEDLSRSRAAWEKLRGDANARGVTGEQIVSLAVKTGLDNSDLAVIWNISCTPGESELRVHDFALFMHFLKHRVNGGELPSEIDAAQRAHYLGVSEMVVEPAGEMPPMEQPPPILETSAYEHHRDEAEGAAAAAAAVPAPGVNGDRLRIFIESVANVKEAAKMDSTHFTVTLVDGEGTPIEPSQNTPIGVEETAPDGVMRVHGGVTLNSVPQEWPEGSAVMLELRHYKQKEKKMSTRCWSFMEKESIRQGLFGLPLAAKPADPKRRKVKLYNKGNPDLKIRFSYVGVGE